MIPDIGKCTNVYCRRSARWRPDKDSAAGGYYWCNQHYDAYWAKKMAAKILKKAEGPHEMQREDD